MHLTGSSVMLVTIRSVAMAVLRSGKASVEHELTSQQDSWGCAGSQDARHKLGHAIRQRQDGSQAANLGQVEPKGRVIEHHRRHIGQTVSGQIECCISAPKASTLTW